MAKKIILMTLTMLCLLTTLFSQQVNVVATDGNGSDRLTTKPSFNLSDGNGSNPDIIINENSTRQNIDGFGYMLTQGSAQAIMSMSPAKQDEIINEYYNPNSDQKVSVVRISIGASDLSNSSYSYNENRGDTDMSEFSLAGPDAETLIPVLKKIVALNPDIKILATPWSAPTWMKTNNAWIGGRLRQDMMGTYALYFRKYLEVMNAEGLRIWGITVQNEPENNHNEPSMLMNSNEQIDFINNHLRGQIENLPFGAPKVISFDHNCDNTDFPSDVANSSDFVDGSAFHLYAGDISALSEVRNRTNKNIYFTEQFTSSEGDFNLDLGFHMEQVVIGSIRNWSRVVIEWNLSSFADFTPKTPGGCSTCLGASTIENGDYSRNVSYYIIGQIARFVDPGATVLASTNGMANAAFKNPDGSRVLLVYNNNDNDRNITVRAGNNKTFSYRVGGRSAVTFKWRTALPEVPSDLSAQSGSGEIELSWLASSGADSYNVFRSTTSTGVYSKIASNVLGTSYNDTDVEEGVTYFYRLTAVNSVGESNESNTVSATIAPFFQIVEDGNYMIYFVKTDEAIVAPSLDAFLAPEDIDDNNQYWTLKHIENNNYTFKNLSTGKFLGIKDNWCGQFGDLQADFVETDDNILFKIIEGQNANMFSFQLAFENCGFLSENNPVRGWDVEGGSSGGQIQTFDSDNGNDNQQFELRSRALLTSVKANELREDFVLFPSPATDKINVNIPQFVTGAVNAVITDLNGRVVVNNRLNKLSTSSEINISNLRDGMYLITFYDLDGSRLGASKVNVSR